MSGLASRMKHRTSVTQRRQQWRRRSAAARERKAHPLFPGSKKKDRIRQCRCWFSDSETEEIVAGLTAKRGRDDAPMPRRQFHKLVETLIEHVGNDAGSKKQID